MAILLLGLALFGIVLARVRVYPEGAEPDSPASAWGFTLPGELLYKRQILWVLVDAVTVLLALAAALELATLVPGVSPVPLAAAGPMPDVVAPSAAVLQPPSGLSVAVATLSLAFVALGLYRSDWAEFGGGVAARIASATAAGLAAAALLQRLLPPGAPWSLEVIAGAWLTVTVSVCGTRLVVRAIDHTLHRIGGARG
ncbi:MAG: hypothetical protein R2712_19105 [Vicinamibacterales bacterium]